MDCNGSPCFFSANLCQLVSHKACFLPEADKTVSKDAKDRDPVVTYRARGARARTQTETRHMLPCTVRARRVRRALSRHACHGGQSKPPTFLKHPKAIKFPGNHHETVGGSGDSVPDDGAHDTGSLGKKSAKNLYPWMYN